MKSMFKHTSLPEDKQYEYHIAISQIEEYIAKSVEQKQQVIQNEELIKELCPFDNKAEEFDVRKYL